MMNAPRFASLSGTLLARKGGAKPAMRPRPLSHGQMLDDLGWDDMGDAHESPAEHVPSSIAALTPAPKPMREEPASPPVHVQQRALSERFGPAETAEAAEPVELPVPIMLQEETPALSEAVVTALRSPAEKPKARKKKGGASDGRKAAFTLRLDGDRHLRLRLASAVTGKSSQQLVTAALDSFLETLPEIGTLARRLPARAGTGH
jgi:hypothetical protein